MNHNAESPQECNTQRPKPKSERQKDSEYSTQLGCAEAVSNSCAGFMTLTVSSGYGCDKIYCTFLLGAKTKFFIIIQVKKMTTKS